MKCKQKTTQQNPINDKMNISLRRLIISTHSYNCFFCVCACLCVCFFCIIVFGIFLFSHHHRTNNENVNQKKIIKQETTTFSPPIRTQETETLPHTFVCSLCACVWVLAYSTTRVSLCVCASLYR